MFMHNGGVTQFGKLKRSLQSMIKDEVFEIIEGNTDSEWVFGLFLQELSKVIIILYY
jgi:glutamine amidotransferase